MVIQYLTSTNTWRPLLRQYNSLEAAQKANPGCILRIMPEHTNESEPMFKNESEVQAWIESVDESNVQPEAIRDELAAAWLIVFGCELSTEDADTQRDAWSHLCSAI